MAQFHGGGLRSGTTNTPRNPRFTFNATGDEFLNVEALRKPHLIEVEMAGRLRCWAT